MSTKSMRSLKSLKKGGKYQFICTVHTVTGVDPGKYHAVWKHGSAVYQTTPVDSEKDPKQRKGHKVNINQALKMTIGLKSSGNQKLPSKIQIFMTNKNKEKKIGTANLDLSDYLLKDKPKDEHWSIKKGKELKVTFICRAVSEGRQSHADALQRVHTGTNDEKDNDSSSDSAPVSTFHDGNYDNLKKEQADLSKKIDSRNADIARLKQMLAKGGGKGGGGGGGGSSASIQQLKVKKRDLENEFAAAGNAANLSDENLRLNEDISKAEVTVNEMEEELEIIRAEGGQSNQAVSQLKKERDGANKEIHQFENLNQQYDREILQMEGEIEKTNKAFREHTEHLKKLTDEYSTYKSDLQKREQEIDDQHVNIQQLEQKSLGDKMEFSEVSGGRSQAIITGEGRHRHAKHSCSGLRQQNDMLESKIDRLEANVSSLKTRLATGDDSNMYDDQLRHVGQDLIMHKEQFRKERSDQERFSLELADVIREIGELKLQIIHLEKTNDQLNHDIGHSGGRKERLRDNLHSRLADVEKETRKYKAEADMAQMRIRSLEQQLRFVQRQAALRSHAPAYKYSLNSFSSLQNSGVVTAMLGQQRNAEKTRTEEMLEDLLNDLNTKNY